MSQLALPEPSWHTCIAGEPEIDWEAWRRFCGELAKVSDARLVEMLKQHEAWQRFNLSMENAGSRYMRQPISGSQIFALEQLRARRSAGYEVEDCIRRQMIARYQAIVEKRSEAARAAAATRRWKKVRTA